MALASPALSAQNNRDNNHTCTGSPFGNKQSCEWIPFDTQYHVRALPMTWLYATFQRAAPTCLHILNVAKGIYATRQTFLSTSGLALYDVCISFAQKLAAVQNGRVGLKTCRSTRWEGCSTLRLPVSGVWPPPKTGVRATGSLSTVAKPDAGSLDCPGFTLPDSTCAHVPARVKHVHLSTCMHAPPNLLSGRACLEQIQ